MTQVPALSREVLGTVGIRIGSRLRIRAFTEVTFRNEVEDACRPDALIVVARGRNTWTALVEAKIGNSKLEPNQIEGGYNFGLTPLGESV